MSIKIIDGNLFDSKAKIIAHQVNCQGKMNSGVAKEVRQRYPHVYRDYALLCEYLSDHPEKLLGLTQLIHMDENETHSKYLPYKGRYIANLYAQNRYGYDGAQYTNIKALATCFERLAQVACDLNCSVAMPYKIGCVRGGANWDEVYSMIEKAFKNMDVELWRLDKG